MMPCSSTIRELSRNYLPLLDHKDNLQSVYSRLEGKAKKNSLVISYVLNKQKRDFETFKVLIKINGS